MSSDDLLGWELIYHSVEKSILKKEDVLVVFLHWALIRSGFLCVGLGDLTKVEKQRRSSELLPDEWNKDDSYSLRYTSKNGNKPYLLKGSIVGEFLVLELVRVEDMTIAALTVTTRTVPVTDFSRPLSELIPEHKSILNKYKTELIGKLHQSENKEVETQTVSPSASHPSARPPSPGPGSGFVPPEPGRSDRGIYADPFGIGRSDIDPLGGVGGGMIYDPFHPLRDRRLPSHPGLGVPGGLPRSSIPPGARFDPFGPPSFGPQRSGRRPPPDADHFSPPGEDEEEVE